MNFMIIVVINIYSESGVSKNHKLAQQQIVNDSS